MTITRFAFPTTIHFGAGGRKLVPRTCAAGTEAALVVTDSGLAAAPMLGRVHDALEAEAGRGASMSGCTAACTATRPRRR